jgi:hypothetical protein
VVDAIELALEQWAEADGVCDVLQRLDEPDTLVMSMTRSRWCSASDPESTSPAGLDRPLASVRRA